MTTSIVGAIAPHLQRAEIERASHKPTASLGAHDYFLQAMAQMHRRLLSAIVAFAYLLVATTGLNAQESKSAPTAETIAAKANEFMQAQVDVLKNDIKSFTVADAQGKDDKQISDIDAFVSSGNCDLLIVSPNTTAALTPAVEAACKKP